MSQAMAFEAELAGVMAMQPEEAIPKLRELAKQAPRRRGRTPARFKRTVEEKANQAAAALVAWQEAFAKQLDQARRKHRGYPGRDQERALKWAESRIEMVRVLIQIGAHETAALQLESIKWP